MTATATATISYPVPVPLRTRTKPSSPPSPTPAQSRISLALQSALSNRHLTDASPVALFYDLSLLRSHASSLLSSFPASSLHAFALKAIPLIPLLKELRHLGLGAECASIAELALARAASIPPSNIIYDSPAKTDSHLLSALSAPVHVNADSFAELARIHRLLSTLPADTPAPSIGLRVNPQLGSAAIAETFTAAPACKFGEPLREARADIIAAFVRYPFLNTVHVHVGSQGCAIDVLVAGAKAAVDLAQAVNEQAPGRVTQIDIGGGLSVDYWSDEPATSFEEYAARLREEVPELFDFRILTEFGRRIAADTAFIGAKVQSVKSSGGKTFVVCHAGADLLLRSVYQAAKWGHRIEVYDAEGRLRTGNTITADVAGPICFSGDIIAKDREIPLPQPGDVIVVRDAGAYTMSMYSRHTSQLAPAVYGYEAEQPTKLKLLKRQETLEDVVRFWNV